MTLEDFNGDMEMLARVVSGTEILDSIDIEQFTKKRDEFGSDDEFNEYRKIHSRVLGLVIMKVILNEIGGLQFHLSKTAFQIAAERYIVKNRKLGAKQLALDTGLTDRQVFKIFAEKRIDTKTEALF